MNSHRLHGVKGETFLLSIDGVTSDILLMFADISFATDERRKKEEKKQKINKREDKKCNVSSSAAAKSQAKTSQVSEWRERENEIKNIK